MPIPGPARILHNLPDYGAIQMKFGCAISKSSEPPLQQQEVESNQNQQKAIYP
jgi:hypothetical protein